MQSKILGPCVAAIAAATFGGCSPAAWLPSNASVLQDSARSGAAQSPIAVKPSKLAFTTSKQIKLVISEQGYKGAFDVSVANAKVAIFKGHPKGPSAKIKVVAKGAGATTLTVGDDKGHKVKVPISVTTAVVVIEVGARR